jgi:hypothetical protein
MNPLHYPALARVLASSVPTEKEFFQMARRGKLHQDAGKPTPGETPTSTPLQLGRLNGYSMDDIAHFYAKRGGFQPFTYQEFLADLKAAPGPALSALLSKDDKGLIKVLKILNQYGEAQGLTPQILKQLMPYRPDHPIQVFRGLSFTDEKEMKQLIGISPKDIGPKTQVRGKLGIHWTTSYDTASDFAMHPDRPLRLIVEALVAPAQVLVEMDRLPPEILAQLEWVNEEEITLLPDVKVQARVVDFSDLSEAR